MIRATAVRALVLTAAFAAALTPVTCLGEDSNQSPTKATKELPPKATKPLAAKATKELPAELLSLLRQRKMPKHSPILVRIFKEEAELEVWKQDTTGHFQFLKVYPICRWSGDLGPKLYEGDRQAPEGFYTITPELMNPNSNFYLAINTGFPNSFDKSNNRDGSLLMIHGDCSSSGCYAMTDEQISEILFAGARLTPRPALIPGPGLSVPLDAGEFGAASKSSGPGLLADAQDRQRSLRCDASRTRGWMCAIAAMSSMRNRPRIRPMLLCSIPPVSAPPLS